MTTTSRKEILIATLGVSPQVVTISLDLLQAQGDPITEVVSVYTDEPRVKQALDAIDRELNHQDGVTHRPVLIAGDAGPIRDFHTRPDLTGLLKTLYREIKRSKDAGWRVHLLIAGGRKVMSAYALSAAQLLFDADDQVWHLFSSWKPGDAIQMHVGPNSDALLVPVPFLPVTPTAKAAGHLAMSGDPWELIDHRQVLQQQLHDLELSNFLRSLSQARQQIVRLLAKGLDNKAIATRRDKSVNTVTKQVSAIYEEWRITFNLPEDTAVRDQIVAELSGYFIRHPER